MARMFAWLSLIRAWIFHHFRWLRGRLPAGETATVSLYLLPADHGDALLLDFVGDDGKPHFIWIDGGLVSSYKTHLKELLAEFPRQGDAIDLMVVTHIDQDHIGGVLALAADKTFPKEVIRQFWFNSGQMLAQYFGSAARENRSLALPAEAGNRSIGQGERLEEWLAVHGGWHQQPIQAGQEFGLFGASLTVLSPNQAQLQKLHEHWQTEMQAERSLGREDTDYSHSIAALGELPEMEDDAIPNGSSIAFLFEQEEVRGLLLGDAQPGVIVESLRTQGYSEKKRLRLNWVKLSHHGSKYSLSQELLSLIDCQHFLISTDGSRYGLPHKATLARILTHPKRNPKQLIRFSFNYGPEHLRQMCSPEEQQRHNFVCEFPPPGEVGMWVEC